jgi:EAL domain-containing protein (putative c-di-GMP-specific phosphodiesterase class I)
MAGPGTLHLQFDLRRSLDKALSVARRTGWSFDRHDDHLSIRVTSSSLMSVLQPLSAVLAPHELTEVRVAFEAEGQPARVTDWFESGSLFRFLARQQSGWLVDMIREDRLTSFFQPIVDAADRHLFGYECLLRGVDGTGLVTAARILQVAGGAGMLAAMDQAARSSALREAARHGVHSKIFINVNPSVFCDQQDALDGTVRLLTELGIDRRQVVFEITESERIGDPTQLEQALARYRRLDFEIALDDVGSGYSSLDLLQRLRPDYSKLDQQLIRQVHVDGYKAVLTSKLLEANRELGVRTIAEGVESEGEYSWLRAHGADVQGYYFARPASPPPMIALAA